MLKDNLLDLRQRLKSLLQTKPKTNRCCGERMKALTRRITLTALPPGSSCHNHQNPAGVAETIRISSPRLAFAKEAR